MGQLIEYWNRYRKMIPKCRFRPRRKQNRRSRIAKNGFIMISSLVPPEPNGNGGMNLNGI
ncbi:hypothetical protein [Plasmodium yoelii yoelii]|uniref:Uncharacterized protein n=1 Tax=Plasmodium yoelii yoelii TaxID=73239 RepID=Q7RIP9_PLAYO|nr:hypothetical protein [Plasmodium yoelii yoelii]